MNIENNIYQNEKEKSLHLFKQARYQEALIGFKKLRLNNNDFLVNWYLGHTYFRLFKYKLAIQSIKKSIGLKSKDSLNLNFLATLYKATNEYELAISTLEEALKLDIKNKDTLINLAEAHIDKGNFDLAEKYFLSVLDFETDNYGVYHQLIKLKKKYLSKELIEIIKKDFKFITDNVNKIHAGLILALNANLNNDFESEISLLKDSHSLYLEKRNIAANEEWNYYSCLLPEFVKKCENLEALKGNSQIRPIFILGMPRSGTTLVESIIASEKKVVIGGETAAFDSVFFQKNLIKDKKSKILKTDFSFNKTDFELLNKSLLNHYDQLNLININNKYSFTDKSITNFLYIDIIKKIFPQAKFIYCSRNPLANILGITKNFLPHLLWSHSIEKIFKYFDLIMKKKNIELKSKNKNFIVINLEELSNEPEKISKDLFKFLDLDWSTNSIDLKKIILLKQQAIFS